MVGERLDFNVINREMERVRRNGRPPGEENAPWKDPRVSRGRVSASIPVVRLQVRAQRGKLDDSHLFSGSL